MPVIYPRPEALTPPSFLDLSSAMTATVETSVTAVWATPVLEIAPQGPSNDARYYPLSA